MKETENIRAQHKTVWRIQRLATPSACESIFATTVTVLLAVPIEQRNSENNLVLTENLIYFLDRLFETLEIHIILSSG